MSKTPGTVSKILWHFTGGPIWDPVKNKQAEDLKSPQEAYNALVGILKDRQLNMSSYNELIPDKTSIHVEQGLKLDRVCCLADIPIQHLSYHQKKYGSYAIGFHRESIIQAKFNPVAYASPDSHFGESIYRFIYATDGTDFEYLDEQLSSIKELEDEGARHRRDRPSGIAERLLKIRNELKNVSQVSHALLSNVKMLVESNGFEDLYCEREWRLSGKPYQFKLQRDVAMIILPKKCERYNHFEQFINEHPEFPRHIPIVPWEDLIEH